MKLHDLIHSIKQSLATEFPDQLTQENYAWWILEAITDIPKELLVVNANVELTAAQHKTLQNWLHKITHEHMPLAYLLGSVPFNDLDILVEPPILIPRPETEEWCANITVSLEHVPDKTLSILDLCSGTACIALTFAKKLPNALITAVDLNAQALALGRKNAMHNGIANVTFIQSDLFTELSGKTFDLIVANPPYIAQQDFDRLDVSVKNWEDSTALLAEDNGLAIIKKIITQAPRYLKNNLVLAEHNIPHLLLEIDYTQAEAVANFMRSHGYEDVAVVKDLEGKDRVVSGRMSDAIIHIK